MLQVLKNIWQSPATTKKGLLEAFLLGGGGAVILDQHQLKLWVLVVLWRVIKGLLSADVRKLVEDVLEADKK